MTDVPGILRDVKDMLLQRRTFRQRIGFISEPSDALDWDMAVFRWFSRCVFSIWFQHEPGSQMHKHSLKQQIGLS